MNKSEPLGEFDLIRKFFDRPNLHRQTGSVLSPISPKHQDLLQLGIGDDCALLDAGDGSSWAISSDMLVEGRHFLPNVHPADLGHKSLAVNLSDLAAMGATPVGFTLSLALPSAQDEWLAEFSTGLFTLADAHHCQLIGGDTTAGPLTISITIFGKVNPQLALKRSNAQVGDDIWVSHVVGDARLALGGYRHEWPMSSAEMQMVAPRMHTPTPRVALGEKLLGIAHAAIDVSDGLLGDLRHILQRSHVNAEIWIDAVPASATLKEKSLELRRLCTLCGGDDYELCFTAPVSKRDAIMAIGADLGLQVTRIGRTLERSAELEIQLLDADSRRLPENLEQQYLKSFDHFK